MQHHLMNVSFKDGVYDATMVETFACTASYAVLLLLKWSKGLSSRPIDCRRVNSPIQLPADYAPAARAALGVLFRASMALTEFTNAFSKTPLPTVPTTKPSNHPLRFLPSRTTVTSMSVLPSARRVKL